MRVTVAPRVSEARALARESRETAPASPRAVSRPPSITPLFRPIVDLHTGVAFAYAAIFRGPFGDEDATAAFQEAAALKTAGKIGRTLRDRLFDTCPAGAVVVPLQRAELNDSWLVRPDDPLYAWDNVAYVEITMPAIAEMKHAKSILAEMRSRGVRLVLAGVGVGRGALRGMAELAPDLVALHPDLTSELESAGSMQRIAAGVVRECIAAGARVIADGVGSFGAMCAARDAGAHYARGDSFGLPASPPPRYDCARLNGRRTRR